MKIAILSNSTLSLPSYEWLKSNHELVGVGVVNERNEASEKLSAMCLLENRSLHRFDKETFEDRLEQWLISIKADLLLVLTFPFKIPEACYNKTQYGIYNIHFAPLPSYRGPSPLFWLIKNKETNGGISIHKVTNEWDKGPLAFSKELPLDPEDTLGMHLTKLSLTAPEVVKEFLSKIEQTEGKPELTLQVEEKATYWPRPQQSDLQIDWEQQTANEIKALVKASNPFLGGAITGLRAIKLNILEVTSASGTGITDEIAPGTIVAANEQGLFVLCKGGDLLRVDIVFTDEGYITGNRLIQLGVQVGEKFN